MVWMLCLSLSSCGNTPFFNANATYSYPFEKKLQHLKPITLLPFTFFLLPAGHHLFVSSPRHPCQNDQSSVGANASRLNLKSAPKPSSASMAKNRLTPSCSAFSDSTSSSGSSFPRFSGPLRRPSSSHRLPCEDLMNATK